MIDMKFITLKSATMAFDKCINEAATESIARALYKAKEAVLSEVETMYDVQPIKCGRWLKRMSTSDSFKCSACGNNHKCETTYCPNCGAIMVGEQTRNLTDEETEIYNSWLDSEAKDIGVNIMDDEQNK